LPVKIKVVPRFSEIVLGRVRYDQLRDISINDLLGKQITREMFKEIIPEVVDKTIIVFGAAGSIGSKLSIQLAGLNPKHLILVDWWENGMFDLQAKIKKMKDDDSLIDAKKKIDFIIGNIQDYQRIKKIFENVQPDVIFNAAAYKHVPLMESNYSQAIKNNVQGSKNLYELAIEYKVDSFILISSDKAVNPTNIMGATKRITEKMMHCYSRKSKHTKFMAVRFGNVIDSNGSVIPTFKHQIEEGVLTITHKDVVRYFMSIDEAVYLILQCWLQGKNDQIYILDMGEPIKIVDLAKMIVKIAGFEINKDIRLKYIGLRPGEKLYEEPMNEIEETTATKNDRIYILNRDEAFNHSIFNKKVDQLIENCEDYSFEEVRKKLKRIVPTYLKNGRNLM
jgi:FlaA1/EpsC-like NDP-sugar epimerase